MRYNINDDTIYAPATVPGSGAITVIRISGKDTFAIVDKVVRCKSGSIAGAEGYSIKFGTVFSKDGSELDEVLASVFRSPHSYTGEDSVEISCHASEYIASMIMMLLAESGARTALPGEFTQRAFLNGKMDLAQAEAVADLIASRSAGAHRVAFNQMKGGFSAELKKMREALLEIVSLMELELDFSEEDVEFADRTRLDGLLGKSMDHISGLIGSFRLGNALKNGIPVAIGGSTNTGKSTLLNALLGEERAIVSDIHGTTRDTVEECMNIDGVLFRFIDTAGIRETSETVEKIGIERTYRKISEAEIVIVMLDISRGNEEIRESFGEIMPKIDIEKQSAIVVLNKSDLISENALKEKKDLVRGLTARSAAIPVMEISAKQGCGIDKLKEALLSAGLGKSGSEESVLVTNMRHVEALSRTLESLSRAKSGLHSGLPSDLASQDIREALYHLGSIVGEISTDEVLGNIFRNFCIGK